MSYTKPFCVYWLLHVFSLSFILKKILGQRVENHFQLSQYSNITGLFARVIYQLAGKAASEQRFEHLRCNEVYQSKLRGRIRSTKASLSCVIQDQLIHHAIYV